MISLITTPATTATSLTSRHFLPFCLSFRIIIIIVIVITIITSTITIITVTIVVPVSQRSELYPV